MARLGFIGLGTMGRPLAKHLLRAGHELNFFARRNDVASEFAALGGHPHDSPAAVTQSSEVIFTIVTADPQVREVALGPSGIVAGAAPGKLLIDMSTISPDTIRHVGQQLAEHGMATLDAPVSGGPWGAEAASLAIMVGGAETDLVRARGLLELFGPHIFHLGPLGAGQAVKLVNQLLAGGIMTLIAEALVLAKSASLDLDQVVEVIRASSGNSAMFEARARKFLLADHYVPGFMTQLMRKDVQLALELGQRLGASLPVARAALAQYTAAMALGQGENDFAAVARVCEQAAHLRLADR